MSPFMRTGIQSLIYYSLCSAAFPLFGADHTVTTDQNAGLGTLRQAIIDSNGDLTTPNNIIFDTGGPITIQLTSPLPPILQNDVTMQTKANPITIDGQSLHSGLFIWHTVTKFTLDTTTSGGGTMTSTNTASIGGNGGVNAGGALGAGGGIFVPSGASVTLEGITFTNCKAQGGNGTAASSGHCGGGGGMSGGTGGTVTGGSAGGGGGGGFAAVGGGGGGDGGGGGGGINAKGGDSPNPLLNGGGGGSDLNAGADCAGTAGGNGGTGTVGSGGAGGIVGSTDGKNATGGPGNLGGSSGGGGSIVTGTSSGQGGNAGPTLGGIGGTHPATVTTGAGGGGVGGGGGGVGGNGGAGGRFGGGGGSGIVGGTGASPAGGAGGFGGGGGGAAFFGGNGGFGGGGGGFTTGGPGPTPGAGGFGGGNGSITASDGGGGGAGFGGAIFIDATGTLTVTKALSISGSSIAAGLAGGTFAGNGFARGTDIFIRETGQMNFNITNTLTIASSIDSERTGTGGGTGGIKMGGSGTLTFGAQNFYSGTTEVAAGILQVSADNQLGLADNPILFSGGTLETTASFSVGSTRTTTLTPGGTVQTDPGVTTTFLQQVTGAGALTKTGTGTLVLSNTTNNYTGATNFNGGTVQISALSNLNTSSSFSFNSGTLHLTTAFGTATFAQPTTMNASGGTIFTETGVAVTFSGLVSGAGALTKDGPGTLALSNASNSYTGTNFNAGIVQISNPGNLGAGTLTFNGGTLELLAGFGTATLARPVVLNSTGTIQLDAAGVIATLNQSITGGGGLVQNGSGTLILTGSNNYGGGTTVNGGTLQGNSSSLQGNIALNNTSPLFFDQASSGTFSGAISGNGSVTKQNTGTLIINGNQSYTGTTTVSAGTLQVDGTIVPSAMTVANGATLSGTGTVGDVTNNGTVAPGSPSTPIGTLSTGSFLFNPGSTYVVEFNNTTSSLIASSGTATVLSDVDLIVNPLGATDPEVPYYTIIHATGGVIHPPFNLINNSPFDIFVLYGPNDVFLVLSGNEIVFNCKGNAAAVATVFPALIATSDTPPDLFIIEQILRFQTPEERCQSLQQMQPGNFNDIALSQENVAERIRQIYSKHLIEQCVLSCSNSCAGNSYLRFWLVPFEQWSHQQRNSVANGYKDSVKGGTVGADYQWQKNWAFSMGFSYAHTNFNITHGQARGGYNTYAGTLASLWTNCGFFVDSSFSFLYSPAHAHRNMHFSVTTPIFSATASRRATFYQHSNEVMGHLGAGYDIKFGSNPNHRTQLYPFIGTDYIYLKQSEYREKGAHGLDLVVDKKRYDMLRPEGGLGFAYAGCFSSIHMLFDATASYAREFRFLGKRTRARFIDDSQHFSVSGLKPKNNLFCSSASIGISSPGETIALTLAYHGQYGAHFKENEAEAELKFSF